MKRGKELIGVDLFAGAGGMSLGFEQAGFDIAASVEYDPIHCSTHEFNFPNCASICRSVADIDGQYIRSNSRIGNEAVDVVFGGAPCQGFSMIGKRALDDPRNSLVYHFVRLVVDLRASYFVFENVRGLTIGEHRRFLEEIIQELRRNGYRVVEDYQVLNAAEHGVPQDRKRLFLFGARKGLPLPRYPRPTHCPPGLLGSLFAERTPTVWDALKDLPEADDYDELLERDWVKASFRTPSEYSARLRADSSDPNDHSRPREYDPALLTSSLRTVHTDLSKKRFLETKHGETEPVSRFLKLDPKGICNTIRAGTASDRGAFTSPRPIHPHSPRCITVREAARLHSYPDWFRFHVTKWHGFRQIGNSVPPLLARAVAAKVRQAVADEVALGERRPISLGDPALLSLDMSEAAARYGVPSNTVPQRIRRESVANA
ncbi:MAG: DNA cytosine methyltransferase [Acidobacteriaceae bacterium]|nr:DNA cytosine methyltransferase [Acidobacteriaceae bacterium]MBV9294134.1 DNA cytosine methyltransferase [Acidobacteriaceae bacterium]MBV9767523.1 DNA cytosine methyltransferase [Acidobacteriaceae bacterium]